MNPEWALGKIGEVQHGPKLNLLFWGNNFWNGEEPVTLYTQLREFYFGLESEQKEPGELSWQGILSQYYDNAGVGGQPAHVEAESKINTVAAPKNVTEAQVLEEITLWTNNGLAQSDNTQTVVLFPKGATFSYEVACGYHGIDSQGFPYSVVIYQPPSCLYGQNALRETTDAASHEYAESVTDPGLNGHEAWREEGGKEEEIADVCVSSGAKELPEKEGRPGFWWVTELWDEKKDKCSLEDPPYPPPTPTATTEPATAITGEQATLNATINPGGPDTHYYFEYGTTTSYGSYAPIPVPPGADAGAENTPRAESAVALDLNPNTTYHYRVVATNWGGKSEGADHTFTTGYRIPETEIGSATELGPTIATVNGKVRDEYNTPRTTYFEYGTTTGYGSKTAEVKETSFTGWEKVKANLSGLAPNTLYHYRLTSYTTGGTSHSADATFTTTTSPLAITEAARGVNATSAQLTAEINPGGLSTTYQFEYWPTGKMTELKDLPTSPASAGSGTANVAEGAELTGLTVHVSYSYRVKATNSHGTTTGRTLSFTAAPPFKVEPTPPLIEGSKENKLESVSCVSTINCMATGTDGEANGMLAEHWNGNAWQTETIPLPEGATKAAVGEVSCWAASECDALTGYGNSSGESFMSLARWNGTSWGNGLTYAELSNVTYTKLACVVTCFAAGEQKGSGTQTPVAAKLNVFGLLWENLPLPTLPTNERATVTGLSCSSGSACALVGYYMPSPEKYVPFIDQWNGTSWSAATTHLTAGTLSGVSCATATSCLAIGANGSELVADHWTGTEWTPSAPPNNGFFDNGNLSAVSCSSATYCVTAGGFESQIVDVWNAGEWQALSAEGLSSYLNAVSCVGSSCTIVGSNMEKEHEVSRAIAVGAPYAQTTQATNVSTGTATLHATVNPFGYETTYQFEYGLTTAYGTKVPATPGKLSGVWHNEPLSATITGLSGSTYHYRIAATNVDGTSYGQDYTIAPHNWALIPNPTPAGAGSWTNESISCSSLSSCIMVGDADSGVTEFAYSERWNGSEWAPLTTTLPAGTAQSQLKGVSCSSASFCMAIGDYQATKLGSWEPLALHWNGSAWSVAAFPENAGANLKAISCPTSTSCTAVGSTSNVNNEYKTLAEQWNGTAWKIETTPNGSGQYNFLTEVSCTSATSCMAGGSPNAQHWNGTAWTAQSVLAGGVSCLTATWCEGVAGTTAESWNGTEWKSQRELPSGSMSAVACTSETACTGMGKDTVAGWNGSEWTLQTPLTPSGYKELQLEGIACPTSSGCMVVGDATNGAFSNIGVVEAFGAPLVTTTAATGVTSSAATMTGTIDADGELNDLPLRIWADDLIRYERAGPGRRAGQRNRTRTREYGAQRPARRNDVPLQAGGCQPLRDYRRHRPDVYHDRERRRGADLFELVWIRRDRQRPIQTSGRRRG